MSCKKWLSENENVVAITLAAIFALVTSLLANAPLGYFETSLECENAQHKQSGDFTAVGPIKNAQTQDGGGDSKDAGTCVQQRAAYASRDQARFAYYGLWLLGLTLMFTAGAVVAAFAAAGSAERTLAHARNTSALELRAYVNLKSAQLVLGKQADEGMEVFLDVVFENYGATPARVVVLSADVTTGDRRQSVGQTYGAVGPSGRILVREKLFLTKEDRFYLEEEVPWITVSGRLWYETIFKQDGLGETTFNLYNGQLFYDFPNQPDRKNLGFHMKASSTGNDCK